MKNNLHIKIFPFLLVLVFFSPIFKFHFGLHSLFDVVLPTLTIISSLLLRKLSRINYVDYAAILSIFIILIYTILSSINLDDEFLYLKVVKIIMGVALFFVIIATYNPKSDNSTFIVSLVLISFLLSIATLFTPIGLVIENRLLFSFGLGSGALFSFFLLVNGPKYWTVRVGCIIIFALILLTLMITANRGGVIALILSLIIYFFKKKHLLNLLILLIIISSVFYLFYQYSDSLMVSRMLQLFEGGDNSRTLLIQKAFEGINSTFPIGAGFEGNNIYLDGAFPHNIILELLLTYGVVAVPFVVIVLYSLLRPFSFTNNQLRLFHALFALILFNFLKSHSLTDIRFLLIPFGINLVVMSNYRRQLP